MVSKDRKLVVFDMDGVLTQHPSSWLYVHEKLGVSNEHNYSLYRERKITYDEFLASDVELWSSRNGRISASEVVGILDEIPLSRNLTPSLESLRARGSVIAIVSAGISWLADRVNRAFNFDYVLSNSISTDKNGILQPRGTTRVDPLRKDLALLRLQSITGIGRENTISIGDSVQDIPMFRLSYFSIGLNPLDDEVSREASVSMRTSDLADVTVMIEKKCFG